MCPLILTPTSVCVVDSYATLGGFARCCRAPSWNGNVPVGANCHCADGKNLHTQYHLSVLVDGQPKTFNSPAALVEQVRQKIELRRRFEKAAATICNINLRRYLKHEEKP